MVLINNEKRKDQIRLVLKKFGVPSESKTTRTHHYTCHNRYRAAMRIEDEDDNAKKSFIASS